MKNDFSELVEYLDVRFNEISIKFEGVNDKLTAVDGKVGALAETVGTLRTSVDTLAVDKKNNSDEIQVLNHRLEKTEDWIEQAAPAVGVKFDR